MTAPTSENATHVHCMEDDSYTEIEAGRDAEDTCCGACNEEGKDPWCVLPALVAPCPAGVTAADWKNGYPNGRCDDANHEPRSGNHVTDIYQ